MSIRKMLSFVGTGPTLGNFFYLALLTLIKLINTNKAQNLPDTHVNTYQ